MLIIILGCFFLFMYISIGMIIGLKLMDNLDRWYKKLGFVLFKIIFWLPNIPADLIVGNMEVKK